jgi:hypothetical protein
LIVWSEDALTPSGLTVGQSFERASHRKRSSWSFEPGQGEFRGALVGTNSDEPHLHYVFAPVTWTAEGDAAGTLSEPQPHWEIKAFIWTSH